ncbi:MAG TPA: hypothetical protein VFW35_07905, partial [Sphingomicrobium sp.]|nr:hypothetical protein [Sphingomicrobium sp.]
RCFGSAKWSCATWFDRRPKRMGRAAKMVCAPAVSQPLPDRLAETAAPKPIVLNIGVTGHRAGALTAPLVRSLRPVVYTIFRELREATLRLQEAEDALCSETAAQLLLHTPLASGADQIAAICARSSGYFVRALLPFEPHEYRKDFAPGEELDRFEQALEAADEIVALPGQREDLEAAYVLVGESLVRTADLMIAIWDGEQARGPGGTGYVVELALRQAVPVIHIRVGRDSDDVEIRLLMDEASKAPAGSLDDPELYGRVLRGAFRLGPAPNR